jgi:glycosyltransferase involved in cell wall biosynthesis
MATGRRPKISVIIPSLNTAKFLRDTIESILNQTFQDYEIVVADGGSTDGSVDILKEYPRINWISEKETDKNTVLEAYRKAFAMSCGDYIIQCCVSDGFLSRNWFEACSNYLEKDNETSLVWGLPQYMLEDGSLGSIADHEFLKKPPPQKRDFFAYWLAFGHGFPEGNYCVRRQVFDECFPQRNQTELFFACPQAGFQYEFNIRGYLSYFIPSVANFGRTHANQRVERLVAALDQEYGLYNKMYKEYKKKVLQGHTTHYFRNGSSEIIGEIKKEELGRLRWDITRHYIKYKIAKRLRETLERL